MTSYYPYPFEPPTEAALKTILDHYRETHGCDPPMIFVHRTMLDKATALAAAVCPGAEVRKNGGTLANELGLFEPGKEKENVSNTVENAN